MKNKGYDLIWQKVLGFVNSSYLNNNIWGYSQRNEKHSHSIGYCYPNLATGILVTCGSGAWQLGNFIEIIPANTIDDYFDIHWLHGYSASVTDSYQINLYQGIEGNETLISEVPFIREATQAGVSPNKIITPLLQPNTRITAKGASLSGGNDTIRVKLQYHKY